VPPKTVHFRVFLNDTHGSRFIELEHGAHLRLCYAAQLQVSPEDDDLSVLDRVFELFNLKHPDNYLDRSLSVGDVVTIFRRADDCSYFEPHSYVIQPVGFFDLEVVILTDCVYAGRTIHPEAVTQNVVKA
jgi:hypothetical protein